MIRVFPRRTKWTPADELAFVGLPTLFSPQQDLPVRISVTFTWDLPRARFLKHQWEQFYSDVQMGGPALGDSGGEFVPGRFLKKGGVITSRGCPRKCKWCLVPEREGSIRELPITEGYDVIDNNLLACSERHIAQVFDMLEGQPMAVRFSGGLDARLLRKWHVERISKLRLKFMWFACDYPGAERDLENILPLVESFSIEKRRCYVLIGFNGDTLSAAERRLHLVYDMGFLPYAMLYRTGAEQKRKEQWTRDWIELQAKWCQPKTYRKMLKNDRNS